MARDGVGAGAGADVDVAAFKLAMGTFATGVSVVTSLDEGEPVGFTCQSVVSLSLEPPLVALSPAKSSTSWPRMAGAGHFCVNVLSEDQEDIGRRFAVSGGNKFPGIVWHAEATGAPVIDGSLAWVDCDLELVHDAGDHEIVIGRVRAVGLGASVGDNGGLPLLYYRSTFRRLEREG